MGKRAQSKLTQNRNVARSSQAPVGKTTPLATRCILCSTRPPSLGSLCKWCDTRLRQICASNADQTDSLLARALREGRKDRRNQLVGQLAQHLSSPIQAHHSKERTLKQEIRRLKVRCARAGDGLGSTEVIPQGRSNNLALGAGSIKILQINEEFKSQATQSFN